MQLFMRREGFRKILLYLALIALAYCIVTSEDYSKITEVAKVQNQLNTMLVFDHGKLRCLSFGSTTQKATAQTCMLKEKSNILVFDYTQKQFNAIFLHPSPQKILLLGLGGGSIAKAINVALPHADLDIVELDKDVVDLAKKFFAFTPSHNTHIYVESAVDFIQKMRGETYDVIIMDVFDKDYIPQDMLREETIANLYRILRQGGMVSVNTFIKSKTYDTETALFTRVFGEIVTSKAGNNRIIIACKGCIAPHSSMRAERKRSVIIPRV